MDFQPHPKLQGLHSFLSASKYHWIRYSDEQLLERFDNSMDAARGTQLHEFASKAIQLKIKQAKTQQTLNMFVNDALGLHMKSEQILYYSDNSFGTADAISFGPDPLDKGRDLLRIHDLKNGVTKSSMDQLYIYAALFCLEYHYRPEDINMELRIYQNDTRIVDFPEPSLITDIMKKIVHFDKLIEARKEALR